LLLNNKLAIQQTYFEYQQTKTMTTPIEDQQQPTTIYTNVKDALQSIFVRLKDKGIPIDVDFIEEMERNVKAYRSLMRRQRGFGDAFYAVPKASVEWDAVQKQHHVRWGDLFFDLTFVASSFRLGSLLEDVILHSHDNVEFVLGVFVFATLFLVMRSVWGAKLDFAARFGSPDLVHKIFEVFEACVVAIMASQLPMTMADVYRQNYYMIWNFTLIRLGLYAFNFCRWGEVGLLTHGQDNRGVRATAFYFMIQVVTTGFPMAVAAAVIQLQQPLWLVAFFWLCSEYFIFVDLLRAFIPCFNTKSNSIPLHVDHVVHREGEFCMLVLGEGVLSIVLLQTMQYPNTSLLIGSMVPGYLILASIQVLHFSSQPWFGEGHALFRSRIRGQIWHKMQPIEAGLIVCIGVGVKVILKLGENASDDELL
jgi:low temperature requirement protein LtrA